MLDTIKTLCSFGERQGSNTKAAAEFIGRRLKQLGVDYKIMEYQAAVPRCVTCNLDADGFKLPAMNSSITGGIIPSSAELITSLQSSQNHIKTANINYNPKCPDISTANFYHAPSIAINFADLERVRNARKIGASSEVVRQHFTAQQFLAGNTSAPKAIFVCHYDSLFLGAVDNASAVAIFLEALTRHPALAKDNLFIFDATEELSYDYPVYWGHGYRVFEERCQSLLLNAEKIIVADCVGYCAPLLYNDSKTVKLAFPIKDLERHIGKISLISGTADELMAFYHSKLDVPACINPNFLEGALETMLNS